MKIKEIRSKMIPYREYVYLDSSLDTTNKFIISNFYFHKELKTWRLITLGFYENKIQDFGMQSDNPDDIFTYLDSLKRRKINNPNF